MSPEAPGATSTGSVDFNIHTTAFPAGEIRGFLQRSTVPEPGCLALPGIGLAGRAPAGARQSRSAPARSLAKEIASSEIRPQTIMKMPTGT
ncbi:CHRD domain-containing protein [Thauera sp. 2A1]|uniref:CHRD domain-containing protein n=1 Tax=Thauera sp. 2A1 TaxID=2570191 RepID=UPI0034D4C871